ncbi:metal-sensitive transcriptional regulator [Streptomyces sp. NRRL F-5135]|uniref:metal-sensitive transcriptional regulator n=1 Tax=Streptomyces sp. NRRL F-5135 TaxID=1463858 RepID=UPI0004CAD19E|nr:metal-sensitive transcriptional regulator [Streptomyces sp. NRRL F-5135]
MTTTEAAGAMAEDAPSVPTAGATVPAGTPDPAGAAGAAGSAGSSDDDAGATDHDHGVHGYHKQKGEHLKRLRRIEGQIRGLQRLVDEDVYCIDILTQVSASTKALQSFALQLLEEHLRHCVADAAVKGGDEIDAKVDEATKAIARLLRT